MEFIQKDIISLFTDSYLSISILFLLMIGIFLKVNNNNIKLITWLSIEILLLLIYIIYNNNIDEHILLYGLYFINSNNLNIKLILFILTIIILLISLDYFEKEKIYDYEYNILILLSLLGMSLLISSNNLIGIYLALELQSLSMYVLVAFKRNSQLSTEASLKYFILGALASGIFLFGSSLIYGLTGTMNLESLSHILITNYTTNEFSLGLPIAISFILIALMFKLAVAPFHMWAPDVYQGAPTIVTAFLAIVPKIAILTLIIELLFEIFYNNINDWQWIIIFCSLSSMIIGAFGALNQFNIKRLLAYSAIGHMGYILIPIATCSILGLQSAYIYILLYMIMSINFFSIILSLYFNNNNKISLIYELIGLSKINPVLAITLAVTVLSMAGIPPLAGFFSKFFIFLSAIEANLYILAIFGVLTSVISTVYYIRLIKIMYFDTQIQEEYKNILEIDNPKSLYFRFKFFNYFKFYVRSFIFIIINS